jgi:hypothetical protein
MGPGDLAPFLHFAAWINVKLTKRVGTFSTLGRSGLYDLLFRPIITLYSKLQFYFGLAHFYLFL